MIYRGETFHTIDDPRNSDGHPWIVVTSPDNDGNVVLVMMTSDKAYLENTTPFECGSYTFVTKASHISYTDIRLQEAGVLEQAMDGKVLARRMAPISNDDVSRIAHDALALCSDAKIVAAIQSDIAEAQKGNKFRPA